MNPTEPPDSPLAEAILRTLIYADVFSFPMTDHEIQHFLIGVTATVSEVRGMLLESRWLNDHVECTNGYFALRGRAAITLERQTRAAASEALWPQACRYGALLAHLPFVRMVALTGALAMRNAHHGDDDIDYLLVTVPGRVWLTRALIVIIVRLVRLRGVKLCPNYVLAETALAQDKNDLYMAHEIAQMVPLAGLDVYRALRAANVWADELLPNAQDVFYGEPDTTPDGVWRGMQQIGEWLLGGWIGTSLENWEQRRKLRKFAREAQKPHSSAQLDAEHVKGHFNDYGYPTLHQYEHRLVEYGLKG